MGKPQHDVLQEIIKQTVCYGVGNPIVVLDGSTCPTEQFPSYPIAPKSGTQGQWIQQVSCGAWPVPDLSVVDVSKRQAYLWLGKGNLGDSAEPRETSDSRGCTGQRPVVFHLVDCPSSWGRSPPAAFVLRCG